MRIPVYHVDAFTRQPFAGNPAAVCLNRTIDRVGGFHPLKRERWG